MKAFAIIILLTYSSFYLNSQVLIYGENTYKTKTRYPDIYTIKSIYDFKIKINQKKINIFYNKLDSILFKTKNLDIKITPETELWFYIKNRSIIHFNRKVIISRDYIIYKKKTYYYTKDIRDLLLNILPDSIAKNKAYDRYYGD